MATGNTSAVLDVVVENKEITSLLKEGKGNKSNPTANSMSNNFLEQSQSLDSFSAIQDIENLSELNVDENSDLCVKIDSPQKHLETLETYITFRITTKVARIEFPENEYVVRRRYNDFVWLRQKLVECHPFCIVPPLPCKHSLIGQLDRYSKDFIVSRMKSLNTFMARLVQHPILSCSEHLKLFLTAKCADFVTIRKQRSTVENKLKPALSYINPVGSSLKNRHVEFDDAKTYLNMLADKLSAVERISSRISKYQNDLVTELNNFHPIFSSWALGEPEFSSSLKSISSALEESTVAQSTLVQSYTSTILEPLKDFLSYIDVVQDVLKKREAIHYAYENSSEELTKKHTERDKLIALSQNPSQNAGGFSLWKQPSCDDKLEKLGTYIPQLLKKVELHQDNLECANESLRSDLQRWQNEKNQCLKTLLTDLVNKHLEYYQAGLHAWEHAAEDLSSTTNFK